MNNNVSKTTKIITDRPEVEVLYGAVCFTLVKLDRDSFGSLVPIWTCDSKKISDVIITYQKTDSLMLIGLNASLNLSTHLQSDVVPKFN